MGDSGHESEDNPDAFGSLYENSGSNRFLCMLPGIDLGRYAGEGGDARSGLVVDKLTNGKGGDHCCLLRASGVTVEEIGTRLS